MPLPTAYTEETLATFIHSQLGDFPASFGWVAATSYGEVVNETLLAYGVTTIAQATNIQKVRALARVEGWKAVLAKLASLYKFQADGASFERQQMHAMAKLNLEKAEREAQVFAADYQISMGSLEWVNDPYQYPEEDSTE